MGEAGDRLAGVVLLTIALGVFVYYTTWVMFTPFIDSTHPIQNLFLSREYAILIPAVLLVVAVTLVGTFIGIVMMKSKKKAKSN